MRQVHVHEEESSSLGMSFLFLIEGNVCSELKSPNMQSLSSASAARAVAVHKPKRKSVNIWKILTAFEQISFLPSFKVGKYAKSVNMVSAYGQGFEGKNDE